VEVEFTNVNICENEDGCTESDVNESYQEGLNVINTVVESVQSGALVQTIKEEAAAAGLSDVVLDLSLDDVVTQDPQTEVVDPTPFPTMDITSSPSVSPTRSGPPPHRCDDSPFKFQVKFNDKTKSKSCAWVAKHPNWKCQLDGVSTYCPSTCGSCGTCSDATKRFIVTLKNGTNASRSCAWVANKNTEARCAIPGFAETCRATFGYCYSDSPNEFAFSFNGKQLTKTCVWVARKNTEERCDITEVAYNCPETCGTCCTDSSERISFNFNGNPVEEKTCEWVDRSNTEDRCAVLPQVALNCSRTCNSCCNDVPYEFFFVFNGNEVTKSCDWVARLNTEERCQVPKVSSKCRKTCGTCCIDSMERFSFQYKGKRKEKTCEWVAKQDTNNRCRQIPEASSNCRRTCGTCS
jgi:hypothetical protein